MEPPASLGPLGRDRDPDGPVRRADGTIDVEAEAYLAGAENPVLSDADGNPLEDRIAQYYEAG